MAPTHVIRGRSALVSVASVDAVAEEGATAESNGAMPPPHEEKEAIGTTSVNSSSVNGEETEGKEPREILGENPDRPQLNLKPFNGRLGGARSSAQGGVTWRDPKGVGVRKPDNGNANPRNDGNGHNRLEFSLTQPPGSKKRLESRGRNGLVRDFPFKIGDKVTGTIVGGSNGWRVALDYDQNIIGFCSVVELPHVLRDELAWQAQWQTSKVGLRREFVVCEIPNDMAYHGRGPLLSARLIDTDVIWTRAKQLQKICREDRDSVKVVIRTSNLGGVLGCFEGLPLFVPWSFLPRQADGTTGSKKDLADKTVGKPMDIMIFDVNQQFNRFVGNNVEALNNEAISKLKIGDLSWGYINNVTSFGAFVTLEGLPSISALLHIRNVSQIHVNDIQKIFTPGDRLRCVVIGVDILENKLSLSTAELEMQPGDMEIDKEKVYANAEESVKGYRAYVAEQQELMRMRKLEEEQGKAAEKLNGNEPSQSSDQTDELAWDDSDTQQTPAAEESS